MLPKDAPSESPNEGGSGSNVSGAATGSNVSASAATSNAGSPGEAPRMALQSMIDWLCWDQRARNEKTGIK